MDSQAAVADRVEGEQHQIQDFEAEIASPASSEIGLTSESRRPSLSAPQAPGRVQDNLSTKPIASSSNLPPLSAAKSGKNSASTHGQVPRPHLRSRASLEKNKINLPQASLPGIPPTPLADKRASSLPVRTLNIHASGTHLDSSKGHCHELATTEPGHEKANIIRSFSTPAVGEKVESFRRDGKGYVLLRTASPRTSHAAHPSEAVDATNPHISTEFDVEKGKGSVKEEADEAISEEEAVCRICMDSLSEDYGETLKMECRCRGEMALAHKECAFKWFGIKGDRVCDVCGSLVSNIPVTVVRFPAGSHDTMINHIRSIDVQTVNRGAVWQDIPVMAIINMMAYFCFIEQLLVSKLGTKALAISIPFSVIIGLLASVTAVALVSRRYIWMYASIQFALVCFFGYTFFYKTKLEAVLAVLVAAFLGFGVAMTSNALLLEYFHWKQKRARRAQLSATPSTMDVEPSFRTQEMSGELTGNNSQWSRELATSASPDLEIGSEPATARGSPSSRSQAASESHHSMHCP